MANNKRHASKDLNHENWDEEDEDEDPGTFVPVEKTELVNRVFRKAKRSLLPQTSEAPKSISSSPFAKFSGFASSNTKLPSNTFSFNATKFNTSTPTTSSDAGNTFSFFSKSTSSQPLPSFTSKSSSQPVQSFGSLGTSKPFTSAANSSTLTTSLSNKAETDTSDKKQNGDSEKKSKEVTESTVSSSSSTSSKSVHTRSIEYYRQLQSLNESVIKWMQYHMSKYPSCDFNPVFMDYKKHYDTLNLTYPLTKKEIVVPPQTSSKADADTTFKRPCTESIVSSPPKIPNNNGVSNTCTHSSLRDEKDETDYGAHFASNTTNTSTLSFSMKCTPTGTSSITAKGPNVTSAEGENTEKEKSPTFSFDWKSKNKEPGQTEGTKDFSKSSFSFACNALSKTSALPSKSQSETSEDSEQAEYEPPKDNVTIVKEEDAIYSKKCKLFFKKGETFADKGVGTLYLKPLGDKTQLLMRADTNLGNILLNIMLNSLPITRTGKNNVLIVCIPNPPIDVKKPDSKSAIPMLIRVKTSEDADELFELLNQHMKKT